jgi:hypothetical protein
MAQLKDYVSFVDGLTEEQLRERQQIDIARKLSLSIHRGDANAVCDFARTTDWSREPMPVSGNVQHYRSMTLAEVLAETISEHGPAPSMSEVMQLLLNARNSPDIQLSLQSTALVARLADSWLKENT